VSISEYRSHGAERSAQRTHRKLTAEPRRRRLRPWYFAVGFAILVLAVLGAAAIALSSSSASLSADSAALAKVSMPLGGGTIESVFVTGADNRPIPVALRGQQIWPKRKIPAHEQVFITVVVKRPGWIAWLAGKTQHLRLTVVAPSASLRSHYLTLRAGGALRLQFKQPISVFAYGPPGHLVRHVLASPQTVINLGHESSAGTLSVEAAPRTWERARPAVISWFPAGSAASAVALPTPGASIQPDTPITLTFNKPISQALGKSRPPVSPDTPGTWENVNAHTIRFLPTGYGYGLGAHVSVGLPSGIQLVGGQGGSTATSGNWTVPPGSNLRLQQLLAMLGYLPVSFRYAGRGVDLTPAAQQAAAVDPPKGRFTWRWKNAPSALKHEWQPGAFGTMMKGAIMSFENSEDMTTDGVPGTAVWKALINAIIVGKHSTFGYTFVQVSEGSPETEQTWHDGHTVASGLVNTGTAAAGGTAQGIFPVFEHALSVTMEGTNPDGSHYDDPGIPYVSYFNGGDALHGYIRASYGFPQSDGCVEMPYSEASQVYPYTPIGTLVDVA
jgi:hypothetical protein